ncbi:unnamed protein product [Leuciscus chuanchicus]
MATLLHLRLFTLAVTPQQEHTSYRPYFLQLDKLACGEVTQITSTREPKRLQPIVQLSRLFPPEQKTECRCYSPAAETNALRHSQTTRVEAQELAAAVYWLVLGRQRSRALPLKIPPFCSSPPLRDHFHRGRAIEEIDDKDLDFSASPSRPVVNPSHPETSSQPGPPAFPLAATGQSGRSAPRLKWLSILDLVLVQKAVQSRTETATQQLSRAQPDRRVDLNQPQSCLDAARARQTERKTERERERKRPPRMEINEGGCAGRGETELSLSLSLSPSLALFRHRFISFY